MKRSLFVLFASVALAALSVIAVLAQGAPVRPAAISVGAKAPDFALKDRAGKEWKLSALRGKVVLLDFGRSMCKPCRFVVKDLQTLHKEYSQKGLQVFAMNLDAREMPTLPALVQEFGLTYPILLDWKFEAAKSYGVPVIPFLVLVDKKGIVRYTHIGYAENFLQTFKTKIEPLLTEKLEQPKPPAKKPAPKKATKGR